jgi:catechol 2,3-dioxygenase-like lactoylglutathione lyase family enzyme
MTGSIVFLPAADLKRTRQFYTQVMGLTLAMVQSGGAEIYDTGYGYWGFCAYEDSRPTLGGPQGVCLSINCKDRAEVDSRWQAALAQGAEPISPPAEHGRFPVYSCFLADPDGYRVELQVIESENSGH